MPSGFMRINLAASSRRGPEVFSRFLSRMESEPFALEPYFLTSLVEQLHDEEDALAPIRTWIEESLKTTITELDYFTSSGGNAAVNWYNKKFEAAHPNITVKRQVVPYANLITKVLQEASAGDLPNIVMLDNPNVPEVAATGQLKPLDGLPGFTTSGYIPGATSECTYQGKQYCYPIGTNTIGLFYNKAMFAAKHLSPPATWAQLQSDAKALTSGHTYGIAFDATSDEQSTWQLEPFFWSQGGNLAKVNTPAFTNSLQLWVNMVKDGSASKSVLQWGQDPDLTQQFLHQTAAMIEDGPWIFPELNAAGWKYNQQYGIVKIPTQTAGGTVVAPLRSETQCWRVVPWVGVYYFGSWESRFR